MQDLVNQAGFRAVIHPRHAGHPSLIRRVIALFRVCRARDRWLVVRLLRRNVRY